MLRIFDIVAGSDSLESGRGEGTNVGLVVEEEVRDGDFGAGEADLFVILWSGCVCVSDRGGGINK